MSESLPPEDNVVSLTASLAERQATATQLPRLSTAPQTSPKHKRVASDGKHYSLDEALVSPSRQRPPHTDTLDGGPKIDEAAIVGMTKQEGKPGDDDEEPGQYIASSSHAMSSVNSKRRSTAGSASLRKKRMTVLEDEEMPSSDEGNDIDAHDSGDEIDGHKEVESDGRSDEEQPIPGPEILELDADEGDEADKPGKEKDAIDELKEPFQEEARLMDSIATLKAMPTSSIQGEEMAVGEGSNDEIDMDEEEEEPTLKYSRLKGSVPDVLKKDSASALAVSDRFLALGMHSGAVYILDEQGNLIKGFRSHSASVLDLVIDSTSEFIGSAGMDGIISIAALSSSETYTFDFKRVMRAIALEPSFGRRSTRSFVSGGMAGQLVLREKSWFGHRETILHEGEGPVWATKWKGNLIAWVTDRGVRLYDVQSRQRIGLISPPLDNPRADLFRCSMVWQDDTTLLIAWADHIKVAKIRQRKRKQGAVNPALATSNGNTNSLQLFVEVTAILQLDCMISGIAPRGKDYLILAYITEDVYSDESSIVQDRDAQKRKDGFRPELRLISSDGDELSSDVLSLESFARFQCNDYLLVPSADGMLASNLPTPTTANDKASQSMIDTTTTDYFYVVSPKDIVIARSRDEKDHIDWLLQHKHYEDALQSVEAMGEKKAASMSFDAQVIGRRYLTYLVQDQKDYVKASQVAPSILKANAAAWEDLVFLFIERKQLHHIILMVPIEEPKLSRVVYDMILAHFLRLDLHLLYDTIKRWPPELYSTRAVVLAIEDRLNGEGSSMKLFMECLAELYIKNRQPGKALPYFLRLRKPGVFDLIREHNLFTVVQDQALLLVEFEENIQQQDKHSSKHGPAIDLLVDHTHSIPVSAIEMEKGTESHTNNSYQCQIHRVVSQLQDKPAYLYKYLDALFDRDPQQVASYSDTQVNLYAEYEYPKLMSYLRAMSSYYSFEKAYNTCKQFDYVPEMVFLLSRIGDNKTALTLIIERLQDVERAIEFVKEEKDTDLWEDLLRYSENKPKFIKGLLENVGSEVDAVKLIKRIKNGLEIEGLKAALIKILNDFNLQISLLEGCEAILSHDGRSYSQILHLAQSQGQYCDKETTKCQTCGKKLFSQHSTPITTAAGTLHQDGGIIGGGINCVFFLCRHGHHISCLVSNIDSIPKFTPTASSSSPLITMNTTQALASGNHHACGPYGPLVRSRQVQTEQQDRLRYQNRLRVILKKGCPICSSESSLLHSQ